MKTVSLLIVLQKKSDFIYEKVKKVSKISEQQGLFII